MTNFNSKHDGISLLEVLLSLAIIAVILIMATRYFFVATTNNKINMTRRQVGALIQAVDNYKTYNTDYTNLSLGGLITDGYFANSGNVSGTGISAKLYDAWGQQINIDGSAGNNVKIGVVLPDGHICSKLRQSFLDYPGASTSCGGGNKGTNFSICLGTGCTS